MTESWLATLYPTFQPKTSPLTQTELWDERHRTLVPVLALHPMCLVSCAILTKRIHSSLRDSAIFKNHSIIRETACGILNEEGSKAYQLVTLCEWLQTPLQASISPVLQRRILKCLAQSLTLSKYLQNGVISDVLVIRL